MRRTSICTGHGKSVWRNPVLVPLRKDIAAKVSDSSTVSISFYHSRHDAEDQIPNSTKRMDPYLTQEVTLFLLF